MSDVHKVNIRLYDTILNHLYKAQSTGALFWKHPEVQTPQLEKAKHALANLIAEYEDLQYELAMNSEADQEAEEAEWAEYNRLKAKFEA